VTKFGQGGGRGNGNGEEHEPTRITVKDKRRIDPATGEVRDAPAGVPQPGSGAANPGDPADATGPVTAAAVDSAELDAARAEAAERTADLQRITAEYANYRKRADRDKQAAAAAGKAAVVAELLAVLDDLDRAEEHGDLTGGFKTVADKLTGILQRVGLTHYGAPGDEFDPNIHEAVQFATSAEVDHPTVTTVLRLGYLFEERVLRPAVVAVTGPEHESEGAGDAAASDAGASGAAASDAGASDEGAGAGSDGAARAASSDAGVSDPGASEAGASGGETADAAK
jgi:molecular chaperone GrpE